jgi:hypothetical protein
VNEYPPDLPYAGRADVAANRDARMTADQMSDLWWSGLWRIGAGLPLSALGVVVAWSEDFLIMALGIGLFGGGFYLSWRGFSFLGDAITHNVSYVTGPLIPRTVASRYGVTYYMDIGPVQTKLSRGAYEALPTGLSCHAYYASGSLHLLSIEPATAAEPHPSLRFGGDAAHAWDRLRWRVMVGVVAVFGVAVGAHSVAAAHPAHTYMLSGKISDYQETTGKGAYRHLYVIGSSQAYSLATKDSYSPPVPDLGSHLADPVDLYINSDTSDQVLALRLRETLYASDYYLHPDDQRSTMIEAGMAIVAFSGAALAVALWWPLVVRARRALFPY